MHRIYRISAPFASPAMIAAAATILVVIASVFLTAAVGFGVAAGEAMVNPDARPDAQAAFARAARLAVILFAATNACFACCILKSGALKNRLHWTVRALAAVLAGGVHGFKTRRDALIARGPQGARISIEMRFLIAIPAVLSLVAGASFRAATRGRGPKPPASSRQRRSSRRSFAGSFTTA